MLAVLNSGCSFVYMDKPPHHPDPNVEPHCDSDSTPIIGDIAITIASGVAAFFVFERKDSSAWVHWAASGALAAASLTAASAATAGTIWGDRCDRQIDAWRVSPTRPR